MKRLPTAVTLLAVALFAMPLIAGVVVEPKSGMEYPDTITSTDGIESVDLVATGVGLREKTFMKLDIYTIVSYVSADADLGDDPAAALRSLDVPKRLQLDLRRGFSRDKLIHAFTGSIDENFDDQSAFAADLLTFTTYFTRDAEENDIIVFDYLPATGLTTSVNGEVKGTLANPALAEAMWAVWFGEKPANKGLREALLSAL